MLDQVLPLPKHKRIAGEDDAIIKLASNEPLRKRLSAGALDRASEYEADRALSVWLKLLRCE